MTEEVPQAVFGALDASGFPLQTAVGALIDQEPNWRVLHRENPWRDPDGRDQFIDLIATPGRPILAVECKKTAKETYTFLSPSKAHQPDVSRARLVFLEWYEGNTQWRLRCGDWELEPKSAECAFCVVSTSDKKDHRLLEPDAQKLIRATEALAGRGDAAGEGHSFSPQLFIPLIVTNAPIFVARYDPTDVDLDTGALPEKPEVAPANWVRFRKTFVSSFRSEFEERTVLVVRASALTAFLRAFRTVSTAPIDVSRKALPDARHR